MMNYILMSLKQKFTLDRGDKIIALFHYSILGIFLFYLFFCDNFDWDACIVLICAYVSSLLILALRISRHIKEHK